MRAADTDGGGVNFVQTETAKSASVFLESLLENCRKAASDGSIFRGFEATRTDRLCPAYELVCALACKLDGTRVILDALASARVEAPPKAKKKPALLAVYLTCRPETEADRKKCSDWACLLILAGKRAVLPEAFRKWANDITVRDAKKECASARHKRPRMKRNFEIDPVKFPNLVAVMANENMHDPTDARKRLWAVFQELESSITAGSKSE